MLSLINDTLAAWRAAARTRRVLSDRLLSLSESGPASDADAAGWTPVGRPALFSGGPAEPSGDDLRQAARRLVRTNPYARNALRLMETYVAGPDLAFTVRPVREADAPLAERAARRWRQFTDAAAGHWSFREHAVRCWRDGEAFVRSFPPAGEGEVVGAAWPPQVRFVDPGRVAETPAHPGSEGIVTEPGDVETPRAYLIHRADASAERVPAERVLHSRRGVDSNQRRGRSLLAPCVSTLTQYDQWLQTELKARKLQASIVLWRKVQGGPPPADSRERFDPGTILTTSPGTEMQFLQPRTNLADAVPLGRMMLLAVAAGTGLPEFMLTADASNANFASTMVAEGPAVKLFESEQRWLAGELTRVWRWVLSQSDLPEDVFERVRPEWSFPTLVPRDRPAERAADVSLLQAGVLSRAEVARRDGVELAAMDAERDASASPPGRPA